jgi:hypothetical protein
MEAILLQELNQLEHEGENSLYLLGATIKRLSEDNCQPIPMDDDGDALIDGELYCVTSHGIFVVE